MTNNEWGFITLPTHADPEQRAIARLKLSSEMSLEHYKTPLLLTHSGGKDSCVLTELALRAEIPFEVLHAHGRCAGNRPLCTERVCAVGESRHTVQHQLSFI